MPAIKISPKLALYIAATLTVLILIGYGRIHLPSDIPHDVADNIQSWCMFIGLVAGAWGTAAGLWSAPGSGPFAAAPSLTEAHQIMTDAKAAQVQKS